MFSRKYKKLFLGKTADEESIEETIIKVRKIEENQKNKGEIAWNFSVKKLIPTLVALPLLCAMGYTTGVFVDVIDVFSPIFGGTTLQTEIIQEIGRPIGASATDNGVTITVDAIIGDENMAMVVYTVKTEDGSPFLWEMIPYEKEMELEEDFEYPTSFAFVSETLNVGFSALEYGSSVSRVTKLDLMDETLFDGQFQLIETIILDEMPMGKTITTSFHGMRYSVFASEVPIELAETHDLWYLNNHIEGNWELKYRFDYGKSTETFNVKDSFIHEDIVVTVDKMIISPFSLTMVFSHAKIEIPSDLDGKEVSSLTDEEAHRMFENHHAEIDLNELFLESIPFYLTKKDGCVVKLKMPLSGLNIKSSIVEADSLLLFDEIIPLEDIFSVTFGEITVELNH